MVGLDTTFLVQVEVQETDGHGAAHRNGITRIATSNARDYRVFGVFDLIEI